MSNATADQRQLSPSAQTIFDAVLGVMQNAEEMGGVHDDTEYVDLMNRIISEATTRRDACQQMINESQPRG